MGMAKNKNILDVVEKIARERVKREFADAVHCRGIIHQPKRPRVEK